MLIYMVRLSQEFLKSIIFDHSVNCVKSLNYEFIVIGLKNGQIQVYNLEKSETIKFFSAHSFAVYLLKLINNNLLSTSQNGQVKLWKFLN